jgi:hypothetical protein
LRYPTPKIFGAGSRAHYKATAPALSNLHGNFHAPPLRRFFFSTRQRHCFSPLHAPAPPPLVLVARDAAVRRGSSGFRGVRTRPNDIYYAEFRDTLGTYDASELAACAYDAATWRFHRRRHDLNFPEVESLEVAELLAPPPRLLDNDDRHCHHKVQRWLAISERNEQLMDEWRASFPNDVIAEEVFFYELKRQRRRDRRRRREIAEREIDNPNITWGEDDARWDDVWTVTTSDDVGTATTSANE